MYGKQPIDKSISLLERALIWLASLLAVMFIMRVATFVRLNPYGQPYVGKIDSYILHAFIFDLRWLSYLFLPVAAVVAYLERRNRFGGRLFLWLVYIVGAINLQFSVADFEVSRFMGCHLTPAFISTYANQSSFREVANFVASDKGGPFLSVVFFVGAIPFCAAIYLIAVSFFGRLRLRIRVCVYLFVLVLANALGYVFTEVVRPGYNREEKVAPVAKIWLKHLRESQTSRMSDVEYDSCVTAYRNQWRRENSADSMWVFPSKDFPYWRTPRGGDVIASRDSQWNVVVFVLESYRSLNCGFMNLRDSGGESTTPVVDSIVSANADVWPRYQCSALPTVRSLASIHLGILNSARRNFTSEYTMLRNLSFTAILGNSGWVTRFFSAADPAWDNEIPWLRQWYQGYYYDRTRETDSSMFDHAACWMIDSIDTDRPFVVTLMSRTNHFPFNGLGGANEDVSTRMNRTQRYTDRQVGRFINSIRGEGWFKKTVFVLVGDHGFPLGEHGSGVLGYGLYSESVLVPLVLFGPHPMLKGGMHLEPASHIDIAPTVLALAGVRAANHFAGRNLLQGSGAGCVRLCTNMNEFLALTDSLRFHGALSHGRPRENGIEQYAASDLLESVPLKIDSEKFEYVARIARLQSALVQEIFERNALLPK